jgi:NADPH:quinone reductase-like Zn-dependent oxidoreductase
MKAAVNTRYGPPDVLEIRDVPKPRPGPGEVLVKVHATTVSRTDCGYLRAHPFFIRALTGLLRPKQTILGMDFAGEVETVGDDVTVFNAGDRVFGLTPNDHGGHAEYLCAPEQGTIASMPAGLRFDEAVVCEGALYADTNLRALAPEPGDKILIYGASGAIGTAAVQLAKYYGAEVTAVVATRHVDLAKSLGADRVIDYTAQDFTQVGESFDFVFDAVGKASFLACRRLLKPEGVFSATDLGPWNQNVMHMMRSAIGRSKRFVFPIPRSTRAFVEFLRDRLEAGEFRAVVDRKYPLDRIVDAYRYVETGQKTGIVVVDVVPAGEDPSVLPRPIPPEGPEQAEKASRTARQQSGGGP